MKATTVLLCLAIGAVCALDERSDKHTSIKSSKLRRFGIKGGHKIEIEKRPYTVALVDPNNVFLGDGVLILKNWVLTAAVNVYSVEPEYLNVTVGTANVTQGTSIGVSKIVIHPEYKFWNYDLALLKLTHPVKTSAKVKPISLANSLPKAGAPTIVSGYGDTEYKLGTAGTLKEAVIPFIPYEKCKDYYKTYSRIILTSKNFCASKPGVGACPEDWGDPLVYQGKLIGIFSGSAGDCGSAQYPGVFVDLTQLRGWIKQTIRQ